MNFFKEIKMKKFISALCAVLLFAFSLSGCGKAGDGKTKIRLNEVTHSIFYAPLYIAIENGFFDAEGLEVELTNGGGADKTMTAVISGQADIGFCGPEAAIYVYNEGRQDYPKVFAQLTQMDGSFDVFVGNPPYYSDYRIADIFLETAQRALKYGGVCYTVCKNADGLEPVQRRYFPEVEIIRRRGYAVLKSVKN